MSCLTVCNFCNLRRIRREAKAKGWKVTTAPSAFMGGTDVWVHPPEYEVPPRAERVDPCDKHPNGNEAYSRYHVAWFMEIGDKCGC